MRKTQFKFRALLLVLFIAGYGAAHAQIFDQGRTHINIGLGMLPMYYSKDFTMQIPPLSLVVEHAIHKNIAIGGFLAVSSARTDYFALPNDEEYWWNYTYYMGGVRGAIHVNFWDEDKWDPYIGSMVGLRLGTNKFKSASGTLNAETYSTKGGSGIAYSVFGGTRYQANDRLRLFGEIGLGYALLHLGISLQLGKK